MEVKFTALVKEVKSKALNSLDKGYEVKLRGGSSLIGLLFNAPSDSECDVIIKWKDNSTANCKSTKSHNVDDDKDEEEDNA